jgi:peroxiredoxin
MYIAITGGGLGVTRLTIAARHPAGPVGPMKLLFRIGMLTAAFIVASGATYVAIHKWNAVDNQPSAVNPPARGDILEGVSGLAEGEVVTLPKLTNLAGETVSLVSPGKEFVLCVFVSNRCPGCTRDADLWRELHKEASNRAADFHLINVGDERAQVENFVTAYNLQQLSILFDPSQKVGPQLKVGFLPQYILFDRNGRVLRRWDGIRHFDKSWSSEQMAEFFQPHQEITAR